MSLFRGGKIQLSPGKNNELLWTDIKFSVAMKLYEMDHRLRYRPALTQCKTVDNWCWQHSVYFQDPQMILMCNEDQEFPF